MNDVAAPFMWLAVQRSHSRPATGVSKQLKKMKTFGDKNSSFHDGVDLEEPYQMLKQFV